MKNIKNFIAILTFIWLATASGFGQEPITQNSDTPSVEPKMEGVVRIGLVTPKTQLGQNNAGQDVSEPVRQLFADFIKGLHFAQ